MQISPFHIAQIAVGTVVKEFDDDKGNQKNAWQFLNSEIAKHDDEVAVVIERDDGHRIGEIWANFSALPDVETADRFRHYLLLNAFYDDDEDDR
ncbi:hypothetical protein [Paraburkholderia sp.]|uniref:hypothetical protein n=1 Tax=Paraburkholderia sp. TaxID=1926495 RepID=UPI003D6F3C54